MVCLFLHLSLFPTWLKATYKDLVWFGSVWFWYNSLGSNMGYADGRWWMAGWMDGYMKTDTATFQIINYHFKLWIHSLPRGLCDCFDHICHIWTLIQKSPCLKVNFCHRKLFSLVLHTAATHEYSNIINLNSGLWKRHMKNLPGRIFFNSYITYFFRLPLWPAATHHNCHPTSAHLALGAVLCKGQRSVMEGTLFGTGQVWV